MANWKKTVVFFLTYFWGKSNS